MLPRDLSLFSDGTLRIAPIPELKSLRVAAKPYSVMGVKTSVNCLDFNGTQIEVNFTVAVGESDGPDAAASVIVMGSPKGREQTLVGVNRTHLFVDQRLSSLTPDLTHEQEERVTYGWDSAAVANHTVLLAPLPSADHHTVTVYAVPHSAHIHTRCGSTKH